MCARLSLVMLPCFADTAYFFWTLCTMCKLVLGSESTGWAKLFKLCLPEKPGAAVKPAAEAAAAGVVSVGRYSWYVSPILFSCIA